MKARRQCHTAIWNRTQDLLDQSHQCGFELFGKKIPKTIMLFVPNTALPFKEQVP